MRKIILEDKIVLEIVDLLKKDEFSYDYISAKYNIGKDQITMINTGKKYKELLKNETFPIRQKAVSKGKKTMIESRLNDTDLLEIVNLLKEGKVKYDDIAKRYNVNRHSIVQINRGEFNSPIKENFTFPIRVKHIRQEKGVKSFKLTEKDLYKIVELLRERKLTFSQIGEQFGVSSWTISQINNGHKYFQILKDEQFPIRTEQIRPKNK